MAAAIDEHERLASNDRRGGGTSALLMRLWRRTPSLGLLSPCDGDGVSSARPANNLARLVPRGRNRREPQENTEKRYIMRINSSCLQPSDASRCTHHDAQREAPQRSSASNDHSWSAHDPWVCLKMHHTRTMYACVHEKLSQTMKLQRRKRAAGRAHATSRGVSLALSSPPRSSHTYILTMAVIFFEQIGQFFEWPLLFLIHESAQSSHRHRCMQSAGEGGEGRRRREERRHERARTRERERKNEQGERGVNERSRLAAPFLCRAEERDDPQPTAARARD